MANTDPIMVSSNAIDDDSIRESSILDELSAHVERNSTLSPTVHNGDPCDLRGGSFVVGPEYRAGPIGDPIPSGVVPGVLTDVLSPGHDARVRTGVRIVDATETKWVLNEHNDQRHAKAYTAGKLAYQQGYAAGSNPHAVITHCMIEAMGWMAGWMDGMNEINLPATPAVPGRRAIRV